MKGTVVVLDSGATLVDLVRPVLEPAGYEVADAGSPEEIGGRHGPPPCVVILDACMPARGGPPALVGEVRKRILTRILQVSGCESVDAACRCHPIRADGFLVRPFPARDLLTAVDDLAGAGDPRAPDFHGMYAASEGMRDVFRVVRLVAPTDSTVLITGETGTGKEMVARAVHAESAVASGPFVPVDCGSLPETLLESELFGHVKGAFTGAQGERQGLIEVAHGGTLFLDEVGNMPPRLQMLLLRALQERTIRPVGATRLVEVDTRVVAATSRDLSIEVEQGRFRQDLFYRLSVFGIKLPPLRERRKDIARLVGMRLGVPENGGHGAPERITPEAMAALESYDWPGNVRELLGVLEGAQIRAGAGAVDVVHLPRRVRGEEDHGGVVPAEGAGGELQRILRALERTEGNRTRAAALLGISRTTLWRRMRDLDIQGPGAE